MPGGPDDQASFDERFGNWGSSPASASPSPAADSSGSFNSRYGNWGSTPTDEPGNPRSPLLRELKKYRSSDAPGRPASTPTAFDVPVPTGSIVPDARDLGFDTSGLPSWMKNALAYRPQGGSPLTTSPDASSANDQDNFDDRFGNWTLPQADPPQNDAQKTRVLRGYVAGPDGSRLPLPGSEQAPQSQPIPNYQLLPPIFGLPNQSASGGDVDDWFSRWIKPLMQQ